MRFALPGILLVACATAQELPRVTTLAGETLAVDIEAVVDERAIAWTAPDGERREVALDDIEAIAIPTARYVVVRDVPGRVWLRSGVDLAAAFVDGSDDDLRVDVGVAEPGAPASLELRHVRALRLGPEGVDGGDAFERAVAAPPTTDDLLFAWNRNSGELTRLSVKVLGFDGRSVRVDFRGERSLPADQVHGLVMGSERGAAPEPLSRPLATVQLKGGPALTGRLVSLGKGTIALRMAEGPTLRTELGAVERIVVQSSRVARLSAMEVTTVEQTPAFDRARPWLRDRAPGGPGLALGGRTYARGLCLMPRTAITFALEPGAFDRFEALIGIDERSDNRLADVVVRVRLDGEVAAELSGVRHGESPRRLRVPLESAESLTLEVDFGENLDLGDHCAFAEARLLKS